MCGSHVQSENIDFNAESMVRNDEYNLVRFIFRITGTGCLVQFNAMDMFEEQEHKHGILFYNFDLY